MRFGMYTLSYFFNVNGVTFSIKKETSINIDLKFVGKNNNTDFFVPLDYCKEDLLILQNGELLDGEDEAFYMRSINWSKILPQVSNIITLKSIFVYNKCFLIGDYADGKSHLRTLFDFGLGRLTVFILRKEDLPRVVNCCEFEEDIEIEHSSNKMLVTNPSRNCRSYATS